MKDAGSFLSNVDDHLPIKSARFLLRPLARADASALHRLYGDASFMQYAGIEPWTDPETALQFLDRSDQQRRSGTALRLGVEEDGEFVGICSILNIDASNRRGEIGYGVMPGKWGKGIARESTAAVVAFAFLTLHLNRLEAFVDPRNTSSIRVLEHIGFTYEATLSQRILTRSGPCDSNLYRILKRDWQPAA